MAFDGNPAAPRVVDRDDLHGRGLPLGFGFILGGCAHLLDVVGRVVVLPAALAALCAARSLGYVLVHNLSSSMPNVRPATTAQMASAIGQMTQATQDRATRHALLLYASALERHPKVEVISTIGGLLAGMSVADVLAALEALDDIVGLGHDSLVRTPDQGGGS